MVFFFTVAMISFAYVLTVNVRNKRRIRYLRNQVFELEQLLEMALIYGKETRENQEKARTQNASTSKKE